MKKFESTWVHLRNKTFCLKCGAQKGQNCVSKSGRETNRLHAARIAGEARDDQA